MIVQPIRKAISLPIRKATQGGSSGSPYGPELIAPLNFTTGWSSSGAAVVFNTADTYTSSGVANVFRAYVTAGRSYRLVIRATFTGGIALYNAANATNSINPPLGVASGVEYTIDFLAAASQINIRATSAATVTVNTISLKEVL